tara:strand:- start:256 stop:531 length:276 start_codon:yes stop_codon:yes gene_type:complete
MTNLKVGCLQLNLERFENFPYIKNKINSSLKEHKDMGLIVISELAITGINPDRKKSLKKFFPALKDLAKQYDTWLIPGTFHEFEDDVIYNL